MSMEHVRRNHSGLRGPRTFSGMVSLAFTLAVSGATVLRAGEFYVDRGQAGASDSNAGSADSPWLTIQHAADVLEAGDTCYVKPGTYEERVEIQHSGGQGNPITFVAAGAATVRGFVISSRSYIRICGFEITQTVSNQYPAIRLDAAHGCEILNNNIHHTYEVGIILSRSAPSSNVLIQGNRLAYIGVVPTHAVGEVALSVAGNNNRVEYNDVSHVGDFINGWGDRCIVRNNYFHDCYVADFPDAAEPSHVDGFQYYSSTLPMTTWLMENNYLWHIDLPDAHAVILRDTLNHGSANMIFRGNAAVGIGAYAVMVEQFDRFLCYHNTFVDMLDMMSPKAMYCINFWNAATGAQILNNIFYNSSRDAGNVYVVDVSSRVDFLADYNLAYLSGKLLEMHGLFDTDPQFVSASDDIHLAAGSPATDSGGPLTTTVGAGSGTAVTVAKAWFFSDGWGIASGDLIRVGSNAASRIASISYTNGVITLAQPIAWNSGDAVNLAFAGAGADRGAFEYKAAGYAFGVALASPSAGPVGPSVQVEATVTNPENVRFVAFYVDGIPLATVDSSPYVCTWSPSGPEGRTHTVETRAYALHANSIPVQTAQVVVQTGSGTASVPAAPQNPRVVD